MTATHGKHSQIILTSRPALAFTNLALQDKGDHKTFFVGTANAAKRYWDAGQTLTFQTSPDGTTWSNATPASVRVLSGSITFTSAITGATPSARVSAGHYLPWSTLAWVEEWAPDVSRDMKEDTTLTTNNAPRAWRTYVPGLLGGTFKLSGFVLDAPTSSLDMITDNNPVIASMVIDVTTGARIECAGFFMKDSLKASINDLESEEQDFQISGSVSIILS